MNSELLTPFVMAIAMSTASAIDIATRRVPNALTLSLAVCGIALAAAGLSGLTIWGAFSGLLVGLAVMLPGYLIGATGGGDVKLLAAGATLLGPWGAVMAFLYSAVAGGVLATTVALCRGRLATTVNGTALLVATNGAIAPSLECAGAVNRFAYAPAIAIGALLVALGF